MKQVHRNLAQLKVFLVNATLTVILFGRGTGKTRGVSAQWVYDRIRNLTRSTGFICSPSYAHLVDTVIPELQQGWADLGLEEDVHYWLYKFPPAEFGIPQPYLAVKNPKYYIFWINGSVTKLVSLDRKALVNSKSFDYGLFVEGRKMNGKIVTDDVMPTIRGGRINKLPDGRQFSDLPEHCSKLIESDLPRDIKGRWILNFIKESDYKTVDAILIFQKRIILLKQNLAQKNKKEQEVILSEVAYLEAGCKEMRKDLVYVGKATSLDNIHVLGVNVLKELKKSITPTDWEVSVLNIEQNEVSNCFYGAIDIDKHGYENAIDYKYVDTLTGKLKHTWRWDKDLMYNLPLDFVMDCNAVHNCAGILQRTDKCIYLLNYFYNISSIGTPKDHIDLANEICDYYEGFPTPSINLIYNNTMIAGERYGQKSKAMDVETAFKKRGWKVNKIYLGQASTHEVIHSEWHKLCTSQTKFAFKFNLQNCRTWYEACKSTPTKIIDGRYGEQIKKDKSSENPRSNIPPQEATHATEAIDQVIQYYVSTQNLSKIFSAIAG